jgi:hypothetical protein
MDEYHYQPTRFGRILDIQGKDMDLVTLPRNIKKLVGLESPVLPGARLPLQYPYLLTTIAGGMSGRGRGLQILCQGEIYGKEEADRGSSVSNC